MTKMFWLMKNWWNVLSFGKLVIDTPSDASRRVSTLPDGSYNYCHIPKSQTNDAKWIFISFFFYFGLHFEAFVVSVLFWALKSLKFLKVNLWAQFVFFIFFWQILVKIRFKMLCMNVLISKAWKGQKLQISWKKVKIFVQFQRVNEWWIFKKIMSKDAKITSYSDPKKAKDFSLLEDEVIRVKPEFFVSWLAKKWLMSRWNE